MAINSHHTEFNLNKFFSNIHLKKQYIKQLQNKSLLLNELKETNYRTLNLNFLKKLPSFIEKKSFVMYIISIYFSKRNTLLYVSDCLGNVKFFYSAGSFQYKGKRKVARVQILKKFYTLLVSQFKFLKEKPIAVHFKNLDPSTFWFIKKLKKKFFITVIKSFNLYPYNGCRKKKAKRKKFKRKIII